VALVKEEAAPQFLEAMRTSFYAPRVAQGVVRQADLGTVLFASKPSSGAAVLRLPPAPV
jgi:N-acetylgalactosamine kinase